MEIILGRGEVVDSGSGTTVIKYHDLFLGPVVKKIFDLPGSENVTLNDLREYQKQTNRLARELAQARPNLITRHFNFKNIDLSFTWKINPILRVGKNHQKFYTASKWIDGVSLGDLFSDDSVSSEIKFFLREEITRVNHLFQYTYPYQHLNIIALNVLLHQQNQTDFNLVITNFREYIAPHSHPLAIFRNRTYQDH